MSGIVKRSTNDIRLSRAESLLGSMAEVDNADLQEPVGKALAKIQFYSSQITPYCQALLNKVFTREGVSLNVKRNSAIYLYQVVELYGEREKEVQDLFLDIQKVFMKFLFDRKAYMQDLSSKALSKIYHQGTPEARTQLVEALSKTLSGEKSASEH